MEAQKKIALFTCHEDPNYGSMLQAFALAAAITSLGYKAEYITYRDYPLRSWPIRFAKRIIKSLGLNTAQHEFSFFETPAFASTMNAFMKFHDTYIPASQKVFYSNTIKELNILNEYDNFIVGSDQTWSPHLYNERIPYFLDFTNLSKRNAYAPSMGTTTIPDKYKQLLKLKLSTFNHISCREQTNCKMLSSLLGREVRHVLDPTLLLTSKEWDKVSVAPKIEGEYILAYILGEKDFIASFAEQLGKTQNMPVYYIVTRPKHLNHPYILTGVGPDDFVGLVKHAKYVVTDSFHGCLFCINYNRQFYAFSKRNGANNFQDNIRILEFLQLLHLEKRFMDDNNTNLQEDVDYEKVNRRLDIMRRDSFEYLSQCLD